LVFGCSDPDFKELNTSGSCCAMPDNHPANTGMENWTRSQLTFHLKEARRIYHKTGKACRLYFNDVYSSEEPYLDHPKYTNDHVASIGNCWAKRANMTLRTILQSQWNNLNSPANPRNYLHGKVIPVGIDGEKNLVYEYKPLEYEERWRDEGIDLTR